MQLNGNANKMCVCVCVRRGKKFNYMDYCSSDRMSLPELDSMLKELGYTDVPMIYFFLRPNNDMSNGLVQLIGDKEICSMCSFVSTVKIIGVFCMVGDVSVYENMNLESNDVIPSTLPLG